MCHAFCCASWQFSKLAISSFGNLSPSFHFLRSPPSQSLLDHIHWNVTRCASCCRLAILHGRALSADITSWIMMKKDALTGDDTSSRSVAQDLNNFPLNERTKLAAMFYSCGKTLRGGLKSFASDDGIAIAESYSRKDFAEPERYLWINFATAFHETHQDCRLAEISSPTKKTSESWQMRGIG